MKPAEVGPAIKSAIAISPIQRGSIPTKTSPPRKSLGLFRSHGHYRESYGTRTDPLQRLSSGDWAAGQPLRQVIEVGASRPIFLVTNLPNLSVFC